MMLLLMFSGEQGNTNTKCHISQEPVKASREHHTLITKHTAWIQCNGASHSNNDDDT